MQHRESWERQVSSLCVGYLSERLSHQELRQRSSNQNMARRFRLCVQSNIQQHSNGDRKKSYNYRPILLPPKEMFQSNFSIDDFWYQIHKHIRYVRHGQTTHKNCMQWLRSMHQYYTFRVEASSCSRKICFSSFLLESLWKFADCFFYYCQFTWLFVEGFSRHGTFTTCSEALLNRFIF